MRKLNSKFLTKSISEPGSKLVNKDYFGFVELDDFACWVIAETYDRDPDIISAQIAVDTVVDMFTKKPTLSKGKLKKYVKEAHKQLRLQSSKFKLRSSIMVVASNYKSMRYVSCGNCKLHVFRGNNIFLKSQDQSLYQEMLNEEKIPDDGKKGMDESRNLSNYLGKGGKIKIESSKKYALEDSDIMVLTTWGFWEKISTVEMLDAVEGAKDPLLYLEDLQDLFLSKQSKTINNYTGTAVFVNKTFVEQKNTKKYIKMALIILIPILIASAIFGWMYYRKYDKRRDKINLVVEYEEKGDSYIEEENYERALTEYNNSVKESTTLTEKKGRKGKENREIKERLNVKQKSTQLIIEGDRLFEEGNYEKAMESYEKALEEAEINAEFYELVEIEDIESKIALCEDYAYTDELIALAEMQASTGAYDAARATYKEANTLATKTGNKDAVKDIRLKLAEMEAAAAEDEKNKTNEEKAAEDEAKAEKVKEGQTMEMDADKALTDEDYPAAIDLYSQAVDVYMENGDLEKAAAAEKKVAEAEDKIEEQDKEEQAEIADGYVSIGDDYMLENKFDEAIKNYKFAKDIYSSLKMTVKVKEVNEKIASANDSKKELERSQEIYEVQAIVDEGDEALAAGDYGTAKEKYKQAQTLYQGLNELDKVLEMDEKIKAIEEIQQASFEEAQMAAEEQLAAEEDATTPKEDEEAAEEPIEEEDNSPTQEEIDEEQKAIAKDHVAKGDSYFAQGKYNEAEDEYNAALLIYDQLNMTAEAEDVSQRKAQVDDARIAAEESET